jgi:hypothetical protein
MIGFYPYRIHMTNEIKGQAPVHIPMVYENVAPPRWEYHVLTVQPVEKGLPDEEILNALGRDGWLMAGLLDERISGGGKLVHYYFVRQATQ